MNLALDGDGSLKIAGFKKTEYRTEMEAYIEDFAVFLGIIAAEALRKRAGTEPFDLHGIFTDFHGFYSCVFSWLF